MQLAKRVWDFSSSHDLLHDGDPVVIGVSGGPDSLCLLDVLHTLASKHGLALHVAHLNHSLRPEAAAEAAFVHAEAERRGAAFVFETVDVATAAAASKQSIETTARALRYDFFRRVARRTGARLVAVAHTADDQAETVLMHLLRGSGLRGLRGMLPKRVIGERVIGELVIGNSTATPVPSEPLPITNYQLPLYLIRPLLSVTRAEILAYCVENRLAPRIDSSNADPRYFRNRLRHDLLPILETYNPNMRAVLARTATVAAGDYDLWLEAVQSLWAATLAAAPSEPGQVVFDRNRWLALSMAQQRALLRLAVEHLVAGTDEVDFAPLDAAVHFSRRAEPGRSCELAGGLVLRVELEQIVVSEPLSAPDTREWPRVIDGSLAPGWRLRLEPLGTEGWSLAQIAAAPRWTAYVDADRLVQPVHLRARRPGDRFQPLGLGAHTMLLSDFLVNQKVPAEQRDDWPLLMCGEEIVWVAGLRLDERYKVTGSTRQVTRLSLVPDADE
jgi:tRNA(Ile)-lysidine synthetase-like protein